MKRFVVGLAVAGLFVGLTLPNAGCSKKSRCEKVCVRMSQCADEIATMSLKDMGITGKDAKEAKGKILKSLKDTAGCKKEMCKGSKKLSDKKKKQVDECLGKSSCKAFAACLKKYGQ